jgi:hypothetical protein
MSTAIQTISSNRIKGDALVVSAGTGRLGGFVIITTSADFSLVPGVNVAGLDKYYYEYKIISANPVVATLPSNIDVPEGWSCKIVFVSATGSVSINTNPATRIAFLDSSYGTNTCELIKGATWKVAYSQMRTTSRGMSVYSSSTPVYPIIKPLNNGSFFSYSGVTPVSLLVGSSNRVKVPFEFNSPGRYADPDYFVPTPPSNTRIEITRPMYARMRIVIAIDNANGLITNTNAVMLLTFNGFDSFLIKMSYNIANIPGTTTAVLMADTIINLTSTYYEIELYKNSGAGSNPTIPGSTYIDMRVVRT